MFFNRKISIYYMKMFLYKAFLTLEILNITVNDSITEFKTPIRNIVIGCFWTTIRCCHMTNGSFVSVVDSAKW